MEQEPKKPIKSPLLSLDTDLALYNDSLKEVAEEIIREGVSKYPIFIAHQHEMTIGEPLIDRNEMATEWDIRITTLEDFREAGVITAEKEDMFIKNYKDPAKFICILVAVPEGANFVFRPYR